MLTVLTVYFSFFSCKYMNILRMHQIFLQQIHFNYKKINKIGANYLKFAPFCYLRFAKYIAKVYIIPGWPTGIAGAFSSGLSTIRHSVVRNMPAMLAAFSKATRATLAGSITPTLRRSSYLSERAL